MDERLKLIAEAKAESAVLQAICAALLCEIAMLHKSPHDKLAQMTASLQGVAHGVAIGLADPSVAGVAVSRTIDQVCAFAERMLPAPEERG